MKTYSELSVLDIHPDEPVRLIVIWLHGLGANATDFEPVLPIINEKVKGIRYLFPNAPLMSVSVNGGMTMPAWYDITQPDLSQNQDLTGIDASCSKLAAIVEEIKAEQESELPIVLAGFSQGGVIAISTALSKNVDVKGVLALSTYLPNIENRATPLDAKLLMMHGNNDPIVPIEFAKKSFARLENQVCNAQWKSFEMDHSLCYEEIEEITQWFIDLLETH